MTPLRQWHLLDANNQVLGRLASQAAQLLIGKHKAGIVPYQDSGDHVVVINARWVQLTGKKLTQKVYTRYSGYPSGLKTLSARQLRDQRPQFLIEHAVAGMVPKNKLQSGRLRRLKVFANEQHPYTDKFTKN